MPPTKPRGRPKQTGIVVSVRMPAAVYDAYCIRSQRSGVPVRTILKRTVTAGVRQGDLTPRQARALALALLMSADDMERRSDRRAPE